MINEIVGGIGMRKINKIILTIISVVVLSFSLTTTAFAATPAFGYKYQNGVGNVTAWLNYASGVGYWQSYITGGANNWMYPGWSNPIYINFVGSNYGSTMDFHRNNDAYFGGTMNIYAWTQFYSSTGVQISPYSSNWYYTEIHINHDMYSSPGFTNAQAQGTTIHEMGHAFGLDHYNSNIYSVMCQTAYGRAVQAVQKVDNDAIDIIY